MIAAHLVWGSTLARTLRDLEFAEREIFAGDVAPDAMASGSVGDVRARRLTLAGALGTD
jgi:hypothetical protein